MTTNGIKLDTLAIISIVVLLAMNLNQPAADNGNNGGVDFGAVVEPSAVLTGQRMFLASTALTTEYARVIEVNGGSANRDLGLISLNSGSTDTTAGKTYKIYYGENSSQADGGYYTNAETYVAPVQDSADNKVGIECLFDAAPSITVFDEYGQVQSAGTNIQAIGADDEKDVKIRVRAAVDECYGNPNAPTENAICFKYNSTAYSSVVADTGAQVTPFIIGANNVSAGHAISCYKLPKLADNGFVDIMVKIKSTSTQPTTVDNITILLDDVAFDIDADLLTEIWGFEDEDNNELGYATNGIADLILVS